MFIFAEKRARSPLETHFLNALNHVNSPFEIKWFTEPHLNVIDLFRRWGFPDIVYIGIGYGNKNLIYALNAIGNRSFVVFEIADYQCFSTEKDDGAQFFKYLQNAPIDMFVSKNIDIPDSTNYLINYIHSINNFRNAKLIFSPWTIDMAQYAHNKTKDIDVAFICSINPGWCYHAERVKIREVIKTLNCKTYIGNVYGVVYTDILQRSKIFIVDTSMRHGLSQKYLEGTACGCMLIGDIPHNSIVFEDKKSMVGATCDNLQAKIKKYLANDKQRQKITNEAADRVSRLCSLTEARDRLEQEIVTEYKRVKANGRLNIPHMGNIYG